MINKLHLFLIVFVLLPFQAHAGKDNPWDMKLPFKNATINYTLSGMENGTETLYIADHGKKTAKYHSATMNMMGMTKKTENIEIMDPDWIYTFDLVEKTGVKAVNPQKYMIEEYNKLSKAEKKQVHKNSEEMASGPMMMGMNAKVEKKAKVLLGQECDKVTFMGTTVYTIPESGIALLTESKMMGLNIRSEATEIKKGAPPKKVFKHPEGIEAVMDPEADAMARSMAKQTMDMLKDPEASKKMSEGGGMPLAPQQDMSPEEQQEMEQAMEALKNIFGN